MYQKRLPAITALSCAILFFCTIVLPGFVEAETSIKIPATAEYVFHATDSDEGNLFNESMQVLGGGRRPVVRWRSTVRLATIGSVSDALKKNIESIFSEISLLTGIRYHRLEHPFDQVDDYVDALQTSDPYNLSACSVVETEICANFVVIVADRNAMNQIAVAFPLRPVFQKATAVPQKVKGSGENSTDDILCFFSPGISRNTHIVQSIVYVQSDLDTEMMRTCLEEEIYQSFGLFGDVTNSEYFSFNNKVISKQITANAKRLLASLYDNSFAPGTRATPIAKQLSDYCRLNCQ